MSVAPKECCYLVSRLILCLCITIAAASYSHGHLHHVSVSSKALSQPHAAGQDSDKEAVCNDVRVTSICTNGYYEDYAYVATQCFGRSAAQNIQDVCSRNSMGTLCATIDEPDTTTIRDACSDSSTICSRQCRDLLNDVRNRLGCCVSGYNYTTDPQSIYRYSLWSLCSVEPIAEQCTPSFPLPDFIPGACNTNFEEQLYSRVLCRTEFLESANNALWQTPGCTPFFDTRDPRLICEVDEQGRHCDLQNNIYYQTYHKLFDRASTACPSNDTCDSSCINTLNEITSAAGCCFFSKFNSTHEERDWLSYDFWQRCGLTSPGFCEQRFDDSPNRISGGAGTQSFGTTISFAVALVLTTQY
jgi:hypothetical protein